MWVRNSRAKDRYNYIDISIFSQDQNTEYKNTSKDRIYQQHYQQNLTDIKRAFYQSRTQQKAFVIDRAHFPKNTTFKGNEPD